jgi:hypothetical protein
MPRATAATINDRMNETPLENFKLSRVTKGATVVKPWLW